MAPRDIPTGLYLVRSVEANKYLGQIPPEHGRLGPERISLLPGGTRAPYFHFDKRDDGAFVIGVNGLTTIELQGKVYAIPGSHDIATTWAVEEVPEPHVGFIYTIKNPSFPQGWLLREQKPYTQVSIDPFASATPEGARFELVPVPIIKPDSA